MKKKLANLLFWAIMALPATAQITILAVDDVKKSEPIDELVFRAQYELKMVEDTTKADRQPNSETMMLEVGKKCSQFYSYTTYLRDSTLIADYANKVSQDVLQQHAKAYGNGRITYRISISRRDLNKVYERYAKDPIGFITSTAPNVKLTVKDEQGNTLKNFELPYNPIELSEK